MYRFKSANKKSAVLQFTNFKIFFLVKFKASTLGQWHHLLLKLSGKTASEILYVLSAQYAVGFLNA